MMKLSLPSVVDRAILRKRETCDHIDQSHTEHVHFHTTHAKFWVGKRPNFGPFYLHLSLSLEHCKNKGWKKIQGRAKDYLWMMLLTNYADELIVYS